ncbi:aminotransferase class V-fold PLP-dependent enzyme, partial [Escherichia coli]|uniref:aminotransferase class V-fold PLP-dependent enzyme n=1 Tax=Escherichia coli TaxID=562 RepID=UPI00201F5A45
LNKTGPQSIHILRGVRQQQDEPGRFSICSRQAAVVRVIAFNLGKHHAYDVGSFLDNYGIAVRTGHHCAMPLMAYYNVPAMCRASLAMYNTHEEVDRLVTGLQRIHRLLG